MNKKLGLAVAGALLALSSTANAGITIPAGDWTLDVSGNVNAYTSVTSVDKAESVTGGVVGSKTTERTQKHKNTNKPRPDTTRQPDTTRHDTQSRTTTGNTTPNKPKTSRKKETIF